MRAQPSAQVLLAPVLPLRPPRYVLHIELIVLSYEQCNQLPLLCQGHPRGRVRFIFLHRGGRW